ncbi:MAG: hypothetical protein IIX97_08435 [Clostridia bacterium]|nr:hypothetical protein [Clostridia bacterium]MBQ1260123.1 hypothetical protein [Clostridia bacterium]
MYDSNENIKEEKGMLYPTIDELTQGKFNRYQLTIGAARGARMLTNEYVKQRVVAEKTQSIQKEAGNKEGEKPISAMVDPEYRDEKAVKLSIKRICDGEFKLVERENGEITDIDEEFNKELAAELAKLQKQRELLRMEKEDDFGDDLDAASDDSEDEDLVSDEEEIEEKAEGSEE